MEIDQQVTCADLQTGVQRLWQLAATKCRQLDRSWNPAQGAAVFTIAGKYSTRGWTQWTEGFQYGCLILVGDALDDHSLIELGRRRTVERMLSHVTHTGVHDHGFQNLSTYGHLLRLMNEGRLDEDPWQRTTYQYALAASGAVQAARWVPTQCGLGYIYSFNGPHSLFIDTMRTIRILGVAHQLGHTLRGENDLEVNLLGRSIAHGLATARYLVFRGDSQHLYDVRGRTAHEGTFNRHDGNFRARSTQQGYSPFSTWTRGLTWAMLGYVEELEFFRTLAQEDFVRAVGMSREEVVEPYLRCAIDTCDHYLEDVAAADGITYWDDGAPQLHCLGDWRARPADPHNDYEPVDASASAIAAQALVRLGRFLGRAAGGQYLQAGLTIARNLLREPYLSTELAHEGLLLHSVYHWPNRWDFIPPGKRVAQGESSMWGDYHLLELALLLQRLATNGPYPTFFLS